MRVGRVLSFHGFCLFSVQITPAIFFNRSTLPHGWINCGPRTLVSAVESKFVKYLVLAGYVVAPPQNTGNTGILPPSFVKKCWIKVYWTERYSWKLCNYCFFFSSFLFFFFWLLQISVILTAIRDDDKSRMTNEFSLRLIFEELIYIVKYWRT